MKALAGGLGDGERNAEDGVGAEVLLERRSVEGEHRLVESDLVIGISADDGGGDDFVDVLDGLENTLSSVSRLVAVSQFEGFVLAGGSAGRNDGASANAVIEMDFDFDSRISAGIQNFTTMNILNLCHLISPILMTRLF